MSRMWKVQSRWWAVGLTAVLMGTSVGAQAQLQATVDFSPDAVRIVQGKEGDVVSMAGCSLRNEQVGAPDLPLYLYRLVIPADWKPGWIKLAEAQWEPVGEAPYVVPVVPPIPVGEPYGPLPGKPDPEIYGSDQPYPEQPVELIGDEYDFGYRIVTLHIAPLRYFPKEGRVEFLKRVVFLVEGDVDKRSEGYALRRSAVAAAAVEETMLRIVSNPERLAEFAPPTEVQEYEGMPKDKDGKPVLRTTDWPSLEGLPVDYIIITSEALAPHFEPLRAWRQAEGLNAVIRTVEAIDAQYSGVDSAERVRNFIKEAVALWGAPWILLGGDIYQVPDRKAIQDAECGNDWGPTDLYFATIGGTWNADGDAQFGESNDQCDEGIDVHVGRAPAEDGVEADIFVEKVLRYEQNPATNFVQTALLMGASIDTGNDCWGQGCKDGINNLYIPDNYSVWRLYNIMDNCGGDELLNHDSALNHLNQGYHYVNHADHCGRHVMGTGAKHGGGSINNADVAGLHNGVRQGILFTLGCSPNAFDDDSVSEVFMNDTDGGLVAYMGNTRTGYASQTPQDYAFFREIFQNNVSHLGQVASLARSELTNSYRRRNQNLLGDPAMVLWTLEPASLNVTHDPALFLGTHTTSVVVHNTQGQAVAGAQVCLYKENEIFLTGVTGPNGVLTFTVTCDHLGSALLTVTARNYRPYQGTLPIQNVPSPHLYVTGYAIDDDLAGWSDGNNNQIPEAGETIEMPIYITNGGTTTANNIFLTLTSLTPQVTVLQGGPVALGNIAPGQVVQSSPRVFQIDWQCPAETVAEFQVHLADPVDPPQWQEWDTFRMTLHRPTLGVNDNILVDDGSGQSHGNGNGIPQANETIEVYFEASNSGHGAARDVTATLTSNSGQITVVDGDTAFGDIPAMGTAWANDPVVLSLGAGFTGAETLTMVLRDFYGPRTTVTVNLIAPTVPTNLKFTPGLDYIALRWTPPGGADLMGYHIYRGPHSWGPFTRIDTLVQAGTSTYRDEDVGAADIFYYYVKAVDTSGNESGPSNEVMAWKSCPYQEGWPVHMMQGAEVLLSSMATADVDFDGRKEIFFGTLNGMLWGFESNGHEMFDIDNNPATVSGFASTDNGAIWASQSLGDLDRDGRLELVSTSRGNEHKLYAWRTRDVNGDGRPDALPGFPVSMGGDGVSMSAPALGDIDHDGYLEIAFTTEAGNVHVYSWQGQEKPGWPQGGLGWTITSPALADLNGDGHLEVIVAAGNGNLYVYNSAGGLLAGWPRDLGGFIGGSPVVGDIDGDGTLEIVINACSGDWNTCSGRVWAIKPNGNDCPGWVGGKAFDSKSGVQASPALAEVNNDGRLEIFMTTINGITGWSYDGAVLPNFPVTLDPGLGCESSTTVGDIDCDGQMEIAVATGDRFVYAVKLDGTVTVRWPAETFGGVPNAVTIDDIDDDGHMELCVGNSEFQGLIWKCPNVCQTRHVEWSMLHGNIRRDGRYRGAPISGWVHWANGTAAPYVTVTAARLDCNGSFSTMTDANGKYQLYVPSGAYEVKASRRAVCTNFRANACVGYDGFEPIVVNLTFGSPLVNCPYMCTKIEEEEEELTDGIVDQDKPKGGPAVDDAPLWGTIYWNCGNPHEVAPYVSITANEYCGDRVYTTQSDLNGQYVLYLPTAQWDIHASIRVNGVWYTALHCRLTIDSTPVTLDLTVASGAQMECMACNHQEEKK